VPALTALRLRSLTEPGLYGDGHNLWLQVRGPGRRSWLLRYTLNGRARSMGLGSADDVSLAEARNRADAARALLRDGIDPLAHRDAAKAAVAAAAARAVTFAEVMERYVAAQQAGWRSALHGTIWRASMVQHVLPTLGALSVGMIDTDLVLQVLEPLWNSIPETASRLRGRIESVLSYAIARGWREGPNPALWRGHLQLMLARRSKVRSVKHFAALAWQEAPAFMAKLRELDSIGARALEFAILTAARSGEVRNATWGEIDLEQAVWSIPANRMKGARAHRVPLSSAALAVLAEVALLRSANGPVFPGPKLHRPLSHVTLAYPLRQLGFVDLTAHGTARSTFRDWAAETTSYPNHVVEQALAHSIGNAVEAAYRRGDLLERRRALMDDWSAYLTRPPPAVVPLRHALREA
jgi:integrase